VRCLRAFALASGESASTSLRVLTACVACICACVELRCVRWLRNNGNQAVVCADLG